MKKCLLIVAAFITYSMNAQITLTASTSTPSIGDSYTYISGNYIPPGNPGANQTWDLSATVNNTSAVTNVVNPNTLSNYSSFPNSNIGYSTSGDEYYMISSPTALQIRGVFVNSVLIDYTDPEDLLRFPLTYGNSYTDNWSAVFTTSLTFYRFGQTTLTCDGYGTLILPNGTVNNVLRIKYYQNYYDSVPGFGIIYTYVNDEYFWYDLNNKTSIAFTYQVYTDGSLTDSRTSYLSNISSSIDEESELSFKIYPTPTKDFINISFNNNFNSANVSLINIEGKEVLNKKITSSTNSKIDVSHLPKGVYFLKIYNDNAFKVEKIIIE